MFAFLVLTKVMRREVKGQMGMAPGSEERPLQLTEACEHTGFYQLDPQML